MISVDYAYSSRQARDYLKHIGDSVHDGLADLAMRWVEHYREVAQPAIFAAHEGAARTGGGGGGHPAWATLSEEYLASRRKRESPHPQDIMQLSGDLRRDLETGWGMGFTTSQWDGDDLTMMIGSRRPYAVWAGGAAGGPRQVMYLTAETVAQFETITNHFLSGLIVKARASRQNAAAGMQMDRDLGRALTGGGRL